MRRTLQPLGITTAPGYAYKPEIVGVGGKLEQRLEEASVLFSKVAEPPATLQGLRRRAQSDRDLFVRVMRSRGWYDGAVEVEIDSTKKPAVVAMKVTRDTRYKLVRFDIRGLPEDAVSLGSAEGLASLGVVEGSPALAETVLNAETGLVAALAARGYPYAEVPSRQVMIDRRARTMQVELVLDAGPKARFGEVTIEGLSKVDEQYVRNRLKFEKGEAFSPTRIEESRKALYSSGVFSGVSIGWGRRAEVGPDGLAPIKVQVTEGDFHSVGAGLKYSSADGFGGRAFWEHRNFTGIADRFRAEVEASEEIYTGGVSYRRPDFLSVGQSLLLDAKAESDKPPAYDRYAVLASAGLERPFTTHLLGTGGVTIEQSDVNSQADEDGSRRFTLIGVPLGLRYDGSDNLLDPSRGHRTLVSATPWVSVLGDSAKFLVLRLTESFYLPLDSRRRQVWATRFTLGSVIGEARQDIPADKRMYAGGADSVRGYEFEYVGPLVDIEECAHPAAPGDTCKPRWRPTGGRSLLQAGTELRWKASEHIGVVPFVEGAGVFEESWPDFGEDFQWSAGLGMRYFTVAGPIRLDVGFPLNPRQSDSLFQIYISLGQAF